MKEIKQYTHSQGLAIVLSGPSGVGKDTLLSHFLDRCPSCIRLVTVTTRPKRETEIDGEDYVFVSQSEFDGMRDQGKLLESADVYGYSYGSPREFVERKRREHWDVVLKVDVQGGMSVKAAMPDAIMVFLAAPSYEELERRLRNRRTETPEQLERRLATARAEMEYIPHYDYLIVNNTPDQACGELRAIVIAEHARILKASAAQEDI